MNNDMMMMIMTTTVMMMMIRMMMMMMMMMMRIMIMMTLPQIASRAHLSVHCHQCPRWSDPGRESRGSSPAQIHQYHHHHNHHRLINAKSSMRSYR